MTSKVILFWPLFLLFTLAGCAGEATPTAVPWQVAEPEVTTPAATASPLDVVPGPVRSAPAYGYTYQRADGNRLAEGRGALPEVTPLDISLPGEPRWVVAAAQDQASVWAVILADGSAHAFRLQQRTLEEIPITPAVLVEAPPLLRVDGEDVSLVMPPSAKPALTHPVILPGGAGLVYIDINGQVLFGGVGNEARILFERALPDARLLQDEAGRLLFLSDPTDRYGHGVLGDDLEAGGITLLELPLEDAPATTITVDPPSVVEGTAPIWADLNGDSQREIIVTLSNNRDGARIVAFDEEGNEVARGPAIGQGFRWRHQIAVAPFGPQGTTELVDVLTPHIGGVVEFYRLEGDELRIVAELPGYTSHVIGTRNLDMAVAGDFDGDDRPELLLPNQARTELGAIQRSEEGAVVDWSVPAGARIVTNLATVTLEDGSLAVGVGREDGALRIWPPR